MSDYYVITDFETNGLNINTTDVPIEIGMLIADEEYNILDTLSCYINPFDQNKMGWEEEEVPPFKVHQIPFITIKNEGLPPNSVVEKISAMIAAQRRKDLYASRFIIMSDNAQFEYNAMQKLFKLATAHTGFPFHYSAWDVNILINSVQKVQKGKGSHKAIQDAFRTYKAVIRALERNGFRKWEK